jgi:PIN domain nuclease of toxin-antitoxin system
MRYLIDTHVLIWYLKGDTALPGKYANLISNPQNKLYLSIATLWELTIKMSLKKLKCDKNINEIEGYILSKDFQLLDISFSHLITLSNLEHHHGDPFDRLLISQAISENLSIISADKHFEVYPVNVIW